MKTIYKPQHGDTAATVADGYDGNFQALDASKADVHAVDVALAEKVDKEERAGLMADAEREKLAGIEAEANAYVLPAATAEALGGVRAGDNVAIAADGTLSVAEPYELPKASSVALGGIKIGNNLAIRSDGTLDAMAGSGGGSGVYVIDFALADNEARVAAINGLMVAYNADPGVRVLIETEYIRVPVSAMGVYRDLGAGAGQVLLSASNMAVDSGTLSAVFFLISAVLGSDDLVVGEPYWGTADISGIEPAPVATSSRPGVVALGNEFTLDSYNRLSLEPATDRSLGGVKVGSGLAIDADGLLSVLSVDVDFSGSEEVIVPGEYWGAPGDGPQSKKQVYFRRFKGVARFHDGNNNNSARIASGVGSISYVYGGVELPRGVGGSYYPPGAYGLDGSWCYSVKFGILYLECSNSSPSKGSSYDIGFKYTREDEDVEIELF